MASNYQVNRDNDKSWSPREAYLLAMVCLFVGLIVGYLFHGTSGQPPAAVPAATAAPAQGMGQPAVSAEQLTVIAGPMLDALKLNPKDADTMIKLGNLYFDHGVYSEAIKYYQQSLEVRPNDVNARTDLGTAYFYSGFADKAVAEFEKSLKIDPKHENTLFNLGIVKMQGLKDNQGAIQAWERFLQFYPDHPQKQKVLDLIAQAKGQQS